MARGTQVSRCRSSDIFWWVLRLYRSVTSLLPNDTENYSGIFVEHSENFQAEPQPQDLQTSRPSQPENTSASPPSETVVDAVVDGQPTITPDPKVEAEEILRQTTMVSEARDEKSSKSEIVRENFTTDTTPPLEVLIEIFRILLKYSLLILWWNFIFFTWKCLSQFLIFSGCNKFIYGRNS